MSMASNASARRALTPRNSATGTPPSSASVVTASLGRTPACSAPLVRTPACSAPLVRTPACSAPLVRTPACSLHAEEVRVQRLPPVVHLDRHTGMAFLHPALDAAGVRSRRPVAGDDRDDLVVRRVDEPLQQPRGGLGEARRGPPDPVAPPDG